MENINFKKEHYHAGVAGVLLDPIPELIGKADAIDEWTDPLTAEANFINIASYEQFINPSCVFLVGRIGSGKTSMFNRLKNSIEKGQFRLYDSVAMIDTRDYIAQLGRTIRLSELSSLNYSELECTARKEWEKTINVIAMKNAYIKYGEQSPDKFKKIKIFLEKEGYISSKLSITNILDRISSNLCNMEMTPETAVVNTAAQVLGQVLSADYEDAVLELNSILEQHGHMLILVDSIEKYEFSDKIILAVLNALVNLCLDYSRYNKKISLKMAAPSELIPKLTAINPEKISSKIVYIRWSHDDLKTFIAVRVYKYLNRLDGHMHVDRNIANEFFDKYYYDTCKTRCGFEFKTFSYCVSYTQKEPRQMLSIFNAWLYYEEKFPNLGRMELIDRAITTDELSRVKGALSIYSSVHEKMFEMFERTFTGRKYCFSESEFDEWLNSCANIRGEIDAYDLKRYFISSGLVGTMIEMHNIHPNHPVLKNREIVRIKEVIFEYQHKECLPFNNDTKFCLHPMVFSALNILIEKNTLVYPKPFEIDTDFIPWNE